MRIHPCAGYFALPPQLAPGPRDDVTTRPAMAGKKGENSKKAAGNAKKAEVAAQKAAADSARKEAAEAEQWQKGAKSNSKK